MILTGIITFPVHEGAEGTDLEVPFPLQKKSSLTVAASTSV